MKKRLNQILTIGMLCSAYTMGHAGLQSLDNESLQQVEAQGGVDLSLLVRLNQKTGTAGDDSSSSNYDYTTGNTYANVVIDPRQSLDCENRQFCRLAFAFNNRYSTLDTDAGATTTVGNQQWLVMKGFQGYVEIPKLSLDAANVTEMFKYSGEADAPNDRVALKIGLTADNPIKIRHLGFESLSIEVGSADAAAGNHFGYLNMNGCTQGSAACPVAGYTDGKYVNAGFDTGREVGFLGLDIHGNLAVQGNMYVFSCKERGSC